MKKFNSQNWSLKIPNGWIHEQSADCDSFFNPNGKGALQFSSAIKKDNISHQDLIDYSAKFIKDSIDFTSCTFGDFEGISFSTIINSTFWCRWYLKKDNLLLFVTYNCEYSTKDEETPEINSILHSLKKND
jgi:hypothetical protein